MSFDYSVRMNAPFTLADLRSETERCLAELVPSVAEGAVDYLTTWYLVPGERRDAPRATADDLARRIGDDTPLLENAVLMTPDGEAIVGVSEIDIGYDEDPEGGRWFFADPSLDRTAASRLLSVAVAVAAARLTGSPVIDELSRLTGRRLADPAAIVARLHYEGPAVQRLRDIAPDVLERVGITSPTWRDPD